MRRALHTCLIWINRTITTKGFIQFKPDGKSEFEPMENWQTNIPEGLERETFEDDDEEIKKG